jgi:hypothetical protein
LRYKACLFCNTRLVMMCGMNARCCVHGRTEGEYRQFRPRESQRSNSLLGARSVWRHTVTIGDGTGVNEHSSGRENAVGVV